MYGNNKSIKNQIDVTLHAAYLCMYSLCSFRVTIGLKRHNLYLPIETTYFPLIAVHVCNFCCRL